MTDRKTLFERMSEAQSMTDRNPTLEAMVEEMARAASRALARAAGLSDHRPDDAWRRDGKVAAQACASIAQKEIERLTAERDALRAEVQRLRNINNEDGLIDDELAKLAGEPMSALEASARAAIQPSDTGE